MAIGPKDWEFIYSVIEEASQSLYLRGYNDGSGKKPLVKPEEIRLRPANKMQLQTTYTQLMKGK